MSATTQTVQESNSSENQSVTEDVTDGKERLTEDEVFHLLQCRRRRDALRYLAAEGGGPVRMRDLAEQVAAWEHETTVQALSSKERQRVYIPLYQTHLPKLDEAGVIEYDQHRGRVRRTPLADTLRPYLEASASTDGGATDGSDAGGVGAAGDAGGESSGGADRSASGSGSRSAAPWSQYFAALSVTATVALAIVVLGSANPPGLAAALVLFAAFGLLTLARTLDERGADAPPGQ